MHFSSMFFGAVVFKNSVIGSHVSVGILRKEMFLRGDLACVDHAKCMRSFRSRTTIPTVIYIVLM